MCMCHEISKGQRKFLLERKSKLVGSKEEKVACSIRKAITTEHKCYHVRHYGGSGFDLCREFDA